MKSKKNVVSNADHVLEFYRSLTPIFPIGAGVVIMNPFTNDETWTLTKAFYQKFYNDQQPRTIIFGINPGRFGGGVTGIPFTDPLRLQENCGIPNTCKKLSELSSIFIYKMIDEYGGAESFYKNFFITAISPLGFTKNGVNLNYYDDKELLKGSATFIRDCIAKQLKLFPSTIAFCLGEGTNYKIFQQINKEENYFEKIIPLPHPRWIMQYRRKRVDEYVQLYLERLLG